MCVCFSWAWWDGGVGQGEGGRSVWRSYRSGGHEQHSSHTAQSTTSSKYCYVGYTKETEGLCLYRYYIVIIVI